MVSRVHVPGALNGPFVVLLEQEGADQTDDRVVVGEDADHVGPVLDLAVETLDRIRAVELGPVLLGEGHVGQHVGLRVVHDGGELGDLWADLVGDRAPLHARGFRRLLGEGGGNEGRDDPPPALAGMGEHVAHEVYAATLPGGAEHLGNGGLDAFIRVGGDRVGRHFRGGPGRFPGEPGTAGFVAEGVLRLRLSSRDRSDRGRRIE